MHKATYSPWYHRKETKSEGYWMVTHFYNILVMRPGDTDSLGSLGTGFSLLVLGQKGFGFVQARGQKFHKY